MQYPQDALIKARYSCFWPLLGCWGQQQVRHRSLLGNPSTSTRTSAPHIVRIIHQYNNVDLIRGLNCLCFWIWYLIFDSMDQNTIWPPLESSLRALSISTTINIKRFAASFSLRSNSQNLNGLIMKREHDNDNQVHLRSQKATTLMHQSRVSRKAKY